MRAAEEMRLSTQPMRQFAWRTIHRTSVSNTLTWGTKCTGIVGGVQLMEVKTRYAGGVKFEIMARGHRVLCDQPLESGGSDSGMTPPEFLLAALASCAGYYVAQYL